MRTPRLFLVVMLVTTGSLCAQRSSQALANQPQEMLSGPIPVIQPTPKPEPPKTQEDLASEKSMQVLEVASKAVDAASGFVSYSGYFLAGFAVAITLVSVVVQGVGVLLKNRAAKKAVDRVLEQLATDEAFATRVIQAIMKKPELGAYLLNQAEVVIEQKADSILTKEYFESKLSALTVRWEQAAQAQSSTSSSGAANGIQITNERP